MVLMFTKQYGRFGGYGNTTGRQSRIAGLFFTLLLCLGFSAHAQTYVITGGLNTDTYPFQTNAPGNKVQYLIEPGDFTTLPINGIITSIYFRPSVSSVNASYSNFSVKIGSTAIANMVTGPFITGLTPVVTSTTYPIMTVNPGGWIQIPLQSIVLYNNTQKIIVEVEQTGFTNGFLIRQQAATTARRMYGNALAASGTADVQLPDFGMDVSTNISCTGQPNAGTILGPNSICPNTPFLLSAQGATLATGLTQGWLKRVPPSTTWLPAGSTTNLLNEPGIQNTTEYCFFQYCNSSFQGDTTAIHTVFLNNFMTCYCMNSAPNNTTQEDIWRVKLGTLDNITSCTGEYNNYFSLAPPDLGRGGDYQLEVTSGNCNNQLTTRASKVWIDYNQSGIFGDSTGELVYSVDWGNTVPVPTTGVGTINIPTTARLGLTAMRVIIAAGASASINPCGPYTTGETEDYLVRILAFPPPDLSGATEVCQGSTLSLSANSSAPGAFYFWIRPNSTVVNGQSFSLPNVQPSDAGMYGLFLQSGGLYSDTLWFNVTVKNKPDAPAVPPGGVVICQFDNMGSFPVIGQNLKWYTVPAGGFGTTITPTINTNVPNTYTYYVSQTVNGCESDRALLVLKVNQKPPPPTVNSPLLYCQNDAEKPWPVNGVNLKYYETPVGGIPSVIQPTINTGYLDSFTYYVTQTVDGCESDRAVINILIAPQPNATILGERTWVCAEDTISYYYFGNAHPSAHYNWYAPGADIVSGQGTQGPVVFRWDSAGIKTVSLVVIVGSCASPEASRQVEVRPLPTAQIYMQDEACLDERITVSLIDVTPRSERFDWDFDGGTVHFGTMGGPYNVSWTPAGQKVVTLIVYNNECASHPITDTINIEWLPNARILGDQDITICAGQPLTLSAAFPVPGHQYHWMPEEFFVTNDGPEVESRIQRSGQVVLKVTSAKGCEGFGFLNVTAEDCCTVAFPDAFTPNGDGLNETFGMITNGYLDISAFRVVNRWGQTVFDSGKERRRWDGTFNGTPQDMGTYYYFVRYKCVDGSEHEKSGEFHLIR